MKAPAPARARGFTLIEMVVVCGILSLLVALLLPAAQAAREAARRAQCASNLRQIGIGLANYLQTSGTFPPNVLNYGYSGHKESRQWNFYSIHARLLPFLDERPIYDAINFSASTYPDMWKDPPESYWPDAGWSNRMNQTVRLTAISLFLCPADGGAFAGTGTNYRGNAGVGPGWGTTAEYPDSGNGMLPELGLIGPANVTDGMSHTAMFGERLRGSGGPNVALDRDTFALNDVVFTADELILGARAVARPDNPDIFTSHGQYWFWTGRERTLYDHAQAPNGVVPDAMYPLTDRGMATARSNHPGGVNGLMGDGSVRFVAETIDQAVWRGLGTRNGGELVD